MRSGKLLQEFDAFFFLPYFSLPPSYLFPQLLYALVGLVACSYGDGKIQALHASEPPRYLWSPPSSLRMVPSAWQTRNYPRAEHDVHLPMCNLLTAGGNCSPPYSVRQKSTDASCPCGAAGDVSGEIWRILVRFMEALRGARRTRLECDARCLTPSLAHTYCTCIVQFRACVSPFG